MAATAAAPFGARDLELGQPISSLDDFSPGACRHDSPDLRPGFGPTRSVSRDTVGVHRDAVREEFDMDREHLTNLAITAGRQDELPVFGAYTAWRGYIFDFDSDVQRLANGAFRASAKAVRVSLVLRDRIIHLARELQDERCRREVTRDHLLRVSRADDRAFVESARPFLVRLQRKMAISPNGEGSSPDEARKRLEDVLTDKIEAEFSTVEKYRRQLTKTVISSDHLRRLRAACTDHV